MRYAFDSVEESEKEVSFPEDKGNGKYFWDLIRVRGSPANKIFLYLLMTKYGKHESLSLADDPADPVWRWFILNGPHGESFQWVRYKSLPKHLPNDLGYLTKFIEERSLLYPNFKEKARRISRICLQRSNSILIRTAIQVLTVIGTDEDMELVKDFLNDEAAQNDAKCALFERGIKFRT